MNSSPGRVPLPASHVTSGWLHTAASEPVIQFVLAGSEQSLLFVHSAITTPVSRVWIETGAMLTPLQGMRLWPLSVVDAPGRSCALPRTALLPSSFTNRAAAASGLTSSTASGSAPPSVSISKTDTRACALIEGTAPLRKESQGRPFSVAFTSTYPAWHGGPPGPGSVCELSTPPLPYSCELTRISTLLSFETCRLCAGE